LVPEPEAKTSPPGVGKGLTLCVGVYLFGVIMSSKKIPVLIRVDPPDHARLVAASKVYRSSSLNWFMGEMIRAMLNPLEGERFQARLAVGLAKFGKRRVRATREALVE